MLARNPAVRHPVGSQGLQLGQAELQGVEAEQIGHGDVQMGLFPLQNVSARRGLEPIGQTYNRAFRHEPDCPARLH